LVRGAGVEKSRCGAGRTALPVASAPTFGGCPRAGPPMATRDHGSSTLSSGRGKAPLLVPTQVPRLFSIPWMVGPAPAVSGRAARDKTVATTRWRKPRLSGRSGAGLAYSHGPKGTRTEFCGNGSAKGVLDESGLSGVFDRVVSFRCTGSPARPGGGFQDRAPRAGESIAQAAEKCGATQPFTGGWQRFLTGLPVGKVDWFPL